MKTKPETDKELVEWVCGELKIHNYYIDPEFMIYITAHNIIKKAKIEINLTPIQSYAILIDEMERDLNKDGWCYCQAEKNCWFSKTGSSYSRHLVKAQWFKDHPKWKAVALAYREAKLMKEGEWMTSPMKCRTCGYEWVAVHPIAEKLQCKCRTWNEVPPLPQ